MQSFARCFGLLLLVACGRGPALASGADGEHSDDAGDSDGDESPLESGEPPEVCDLDSHEHDCDGDGIPDADDPFVTDPYRPGRARIDVIYGHSSTDLFTVDPRVGLTGEDIGWVGRFFRDDPGTIELLDLAIDRFGVMYGVSVDSLLACHPATAQCWALGSVSTNSLAFLPLGVLDADDDTLVTLAGTRWTRIDLRGPEMTVVEIAEVSAPYSSSGDIATTADGTTLFTSPSSQSDVVVAIDPTTGAILGTIGQATGLSNVWGVAAFDDQIWLFDSLGSIASFDPQTGETNLEGVGPDFWWGAAAHPGAG